MLGSSSKINSRNTDGAKLTKETNAELQTNIWGCKVDDYRVCSERSSSKLNSSNRKQN